MVQLDLVSWVNQVYLCLPSLLVVRLAQVVLVCWGNRGYHRLLSLPEGQGNLVYLCLPSLLVVLVRQHLPEGQGIRGDPYLLSPLVVLGILVSRGIHYPP